MGTYEKGGRDREGQEGAKVRKMEDGAKDRKKQGRSLQLEITLHQAEDSICLACFRYHRVEVLIRIWVLGLSVGMVLTCPNHQSVNQTHHITLGVLSFGYVSSDLFCISSRYALDVFGPKHTCSALSLLKVQSSRLYNVTTGKRSTSYIAPSAARRWTTIDRRFTYPTFDEVTPASDLIRVKSQDTPMIGITEQLSFHSILRESSLSRLKGTVLHLTTLQWVECISPTRGHFRHLGPGSRRNG